MLEKIEGRRRRGRQRMRWLDASPTQWTWVWASSEGRWWTGKPGVLQSMGSQRVGHDWVTEQQQQQPYFLFIVLIKPRNQCTCVKTSYPSPTRLLPELSLPPASSSLLRSPPASVWSREAPYSARLPCLLPANQSTLVMRKVKKACTYFMGQHPRKPFFPSGSPKGGR